jgi:hypothetical protein
LVMLLGLVFRVVTVNVFISLLILDLLLVFFSHGLTLYHII